MRAALSLLVVVGCSSGASTDPGTLPDAEAGGTVAVDPVYLPEAPPGEIPAGHVHIGPERVSASFSERSVDFPTDGGCTYELLDACLARTCRDPVGSREPTPVRLPDRVLLSSATLGAVVLTKDENGAWLDLPKPLPAGESVTARLEGGELSGWEVTLTQPAMPTLGTLGGCAMPHDGSCSIDLSQPATWTATAHGHPTLLLDAEGRGSRTVVWCTYPEGSTAGVVPAAVRAKLRGRALYFASSYGTARRSDRAATGLTVLMEATSTAMGVRFAPAVPL